MPLPGWLAAQLAEPVPPLRASQPFRRTAPAAAHAARYTQAALDGEIRRVAAAPVGRRNDTLNRAAFAFGHLTAAGLLTHSLAHTELTAAARRARLDRDPGCRPRGIQATIRSGLAAGAHKPRTRAA